MAAKNIYQGIINAVAEHRKQLAILIDPDTFDIAFSAEFLRKLPSETTHIFVGGSTVASGKTETVVNELKLYTSRPIILFPGDVSQITAAADALLYLSLLSGNNTEYLLGQQVKAVTVLRGMDLEVIPTAYILVDGGNRSAVERVTNTAPISQNNVQLIVDTAKAGEFMGKALIYLEAGSGANYPVSPELISEVKKELSIPLIVGGGIRSEIQKEQAYTAGADMVVMGTAFENRAT